MSPERWQEISSIFADLLDVPPDVREAELARLCKGDPVCGSQVRSLLSEHELSGSFLEISAVAGPLIAGDRDFAPRSTFQSNEIVAGRFRIERLLGTGGMGEVYEAFDSGLRQAVAIKSLRSPGFRDTVLTERFRTEVLRSRQVTHPNVARVHDLFNHRLEDGCEVPFFTMALLQGETLAAWLARNGPCKPTPALQLLRQVAEALEAAHRVGIVHRDLKPANIFICTGAEGPIQAIVTDFGIATESAVADETGTLLPSPGEMTGVAGTPAYMAPEQLCGEPASSRTDVYAFGLLAYELLTGTPAFPEASSLVCALKKLAPEGQAVSWERPGIPPLWAGAIARAVRRSPADRFGSPGEFVAAVTEPAVQALPTSRFSRRRLAAAGAGLLIPAAAVSVMRKNGIFGTAGTASIAVLPFSSRETPSQTSYFSEGLAEELGQALTGYPKLQVAAQAAAARYRGSVRPLTEIAHELQVGRVLTGSAGRSNGRVHISVQLVDGSTGRQIWSQIYDRDEREVFAVQREIVTALASKLEAGSLNDSIKDRTASVGAWDAYLQGRFQGNTRTQAGLLKSLELYGESIRLDPDFVSAHTAIANTYIGLIDYGWISPRDAAPRIRDALHRALAIDPDAADTQASLGYFNNLVEWDQSGAERAFQRALALRASQFDAHLWYGNFLMRAGRLDEALREADQAIRLDAVSPSTLLFKGWIRYYRREYDEAIQVCRQAIARNSSIQHPFQLMSLAFARMRREKEALESNATAVRMTSDRAVGLRERAWTLSLIPGHEGEAAAAAQQMAVAAPGRQTAFLAFVYAGLKDRDRMYQYAASAIDERDSAFLLANVDPAFDPFRTEQRFIEMMRTLGYAR